MGLILCGHQRSGTTLLQYLCTRHPDITVTMEFGSFLSLETTYSQYARHILKTWWTIKNQWRICPGGTYLKLRMLANLILVSRYLYHLHHYRNQIIDAPAVDACLEKTFKTKVVGDKWPDYIYLLDYLTASKGLKVIVVFRDALDVASSTLGMSRTVWKSQPWVGLLDTAEKVAHRWVNTIEIMERHGPSVHRIQYEGLVRTPTEVFDRMGDWLGVDPKGFPTDSIRDNNIGKHKNGLTNEEIDIVLRIAAPTMKRLGYL